MDQKFLRNIDFETVHQLGELVLYQPGQIVSRTLVQNSAVGITLFAFDKGEQISSHESTGDALVYLIDGSATITIGGKTHEVTKGQCIVMPAGVAHAVEALACFKMLLVVVFPS